MIKVSLIVAVYNAAQHLRQCLDSLCNQTLADIEIVIVNDGSTDNSRSICEEYAQRDHRVVVINQENQGTLAARIAGIQSAQGNYILFVDSDDFIADDAASDLYSLITLHQTDVLQFSVRRFSASSGKTHIFKHAQPHIGKLEGTALRHHHFVFQDGHLNTYMWDKIYRASVIKQAIAYVDIDRASMHEDYYLLFLIMWHASTLVGVDTKPYYFYHRSRGISAKSQISLREFAEFCRAGEFRNSLQRFLSFHPYDPVLSDAVEIVFRRQAAYAVERYFRAVSQQDAEDAWAMLCQRFPATYIVAEVQKRKATLASRLKCWVLSKIALGKTRTHYERKAVEQQRYLQIEQYMQTSR